MPPENPKTATDTDDLAPEEYAWSCAEDMRGWAMRAEEAARDAREENYALRREVADLKRRLGYPRFAR
jgi:hypothetical protein